MINTQSLTKYYDAKPAVVDVDLFVPRGEICGLIGPNGAGKTTLLKMVAGLLRPSSGMIEVAGVDVGAEPKRLHSMVGYVPDTFGLYDELSVRHFLEYFARAHKVDRDKIDKRIFKVLELTNLTSKIDARVGSLSRGMRQRLVIAKTLLHAPEILLLDEPASGLDPLARIELRELIKELGKLGTTLIVSSHILNELEDFCSSLVIMERGHILRSGKVEQLLNEFSSGTRVCIDLISKEQAAELSAALHGNALVTGLTLDETAVQFAFDGNRDELAQLHRDLVISFNGIVSFYERKQTIEDIFMALGSHQVS
jgi:ABC-2 type transport system ATP-binding protein